MNLKNILKNLFNRNTHSEDVEQTDTYEWEQDEYLVQLGAKINKNKRGKAGEDYVKTIFTLGNFRTEFLGDKAEDVDCFVSFPDKDKIYEFLVQVKTSGSMQESKSTVNSGISKDEYKRLQRYHLPTYLARVDMNKQIVYIKGAFKSAKHASYSRVSKQYQLSIDKLDVSRKIMNGIATDVKRYWEEGLAKDYKTKYNSYFS